MVDIIHTHLMDRDAPLPSDTQAQLYNGLDVCITYEVLDALKARADETSNKVYERSFALQIPTIEMSLRGMPLDSQKRARLLAETKKMVFNLERRYNALCEGVFRTAFNWRSPKQLADLFYSPAFLGCDPARKRSKSTGKWGVSTDEQALLKLWNYFSARPFINYVLKLRSLVKEIEALEVKTRGDRFPSSYNVVGTNTGRLSSSSDEFDEGSNAQNIKRKLKETIVADNGMKLGNIDLEQADSRNFGACCVQYLHEELGETVASQYLDACEGDDLHTVVAKMTWQTELPWGTAPDREVAEGALFFKEDTYRQAAKKLGHGTNYFGQPPAISFETGVPIDLVREFQTRYFAAFECIVPMHQWVIKQLRESSQLTTLFNRRRYFWGRPTDKNVQNEAVAFLGQSCTADQVNFGLLNVWKLNRVQLLAQVHDSIFFQFPEEQEDEIMPLVIKAMEIEITLANGRPFMVPVEAETGWNWGKYDEKKNPDGMKKWKGDDTRKRRIARAGSRFSFQSLRQRSA